MTNILAVAAWFLVAFFLGIVPAAWFFSTDNIVAGILAVVTGYGLGALAAEGVYRWLE